jgi:uncharacterized protein (DUF779 family)
MAVITISDAGTSRLAEFADYPGGVAFKIDNGCCGGTTLLLIEAAYLGSGDIRIGEVNNIGIYVDRALQDSYAADTYHIDVRVGARDSGFSLEIPRGFKFLMTRTVVEGRGIGGSDETCPIETSG